MLSQLSNFQFESPWWLLLLLAIPMMIWWQYFSGRKEESVMTYSDLGGLPLVKTWKERIYPYLPVFNILSIFLFIMAMARPQLVLTEEKVTSEGIDIMLAIDLSSSMLARDFTPDRMEVSKMVAEEFVTQRPYDRIGLVAFAGEAYTQCPLTTDHAMVIDLLSDLQIGIIEDGTAIGMGLATAVNRLKDSDSKSKIVILLTDGVNNTGYIQPKTAAEIAVQYGIRVYTVGVGTMGNAPMPVYRLPDGSFQFRMARVEIDTELLKEISSMTQGKYFRATDRKSLENIYSEIDRLEKTEIETQVFKRNQDVYRLFLIPGIFVLSLGWILKRTLFQTIN